MLLTVFDRGTVACAGDSTKSGSELATGTSSSFVAGGRFGDPRTLLGIRQTGRVMDGLISGYIGNSVGLSLDIRLKHPV